MRNPWWILVALAITWAVAVLLFEVTEAHAAWFGIGEAVGAISDAVWKVKLIEAITQSWQSIILLATIVGFIVCTGIAGYIVIRLNGTAQKILQDNRQDVGEWVLFALVFIVSAPIASGLLWFGYFLATTAKHGLEQLMG